MDVQYFRTAVPDLLFGIPDSKTRTSFWAK